MRSSPAIDSIPSNFTNDTCVSYATFSGADFFLQVVRHLLSNKAPILIKVVTTHLCILPRGLMMHLLRLMACQMIQVLVSPV